LRWGRRFATEVGAGGGGGGGPAEREVKTDAV
jgi:hypothetical protein